MKTLNLSSFEQLEKSGYLQELVELYQRVFKEWGESHDPTYLVSRLSRELNNDSTQKPFMSLLLVDGKVEGACWGAFIKSKDLIGRIKKQKTNESAEDNFTEDDLREIAKIFNKGSATIQFWDEIFVSKESRGWGAVAELVRYGARMFPSVATVMWTNTKASMFAKIARKYWGAKNVYITEKGFTFLVVEKTLMFKLVYRLGLDRKIKPKKIPLQTLVN